MGEPCYALLSLEKEGFACGVFVTYEGQGSLENRRGCRGGVQSLAPGGFSPDHVPVGSPAVLVQPHREGSLLWAPDLDIPCFEPVCHSLDGERRESLPRVSLPSLGWCERDRK